MIKITNLSKSYEDKKAVDGLSLTIPEGTVFGFLGPNGAGKTTTIKMIVGINSPDEGTVLVNGKATHIPAERQEIGFMPEEPHFYDQLTGFEFMKFADNLFSNNRQISEEKIEEILRKVGIYEARNEKIRNYSKGMKQRLGFAQTLVNNPKYIFLDEPLEGLDPIGRREIKNIIEDLKKKGKTIFFNSHILSDVESLCDNIGIINKGKLIYSGPVNEFKKSLSLEDKFVETIQNIK